MKLPKLTSLTAATLLLTFAVNAQSDTNVAQVIKLDNPSFEGVPQATFSPRGWYDCGFAGETPPDIQAGDGSIFSVVLRPKEGNTFLGMVVRDNFTNERVGQKLNSSLYADSVYTFSIWIAKSSSYLSPSKSSPGQLVNYTTPAVLRIWGGDNYCEKLQCLAESEPVTNTSWQRYDFFMRPNQDVSYITLEAYYTALTKTPYCGNILLDAASDIVKVAAGMEAEIGTGIVDIEAVTLENSNPPIVLQQEKYNKPMPSKERPLPTYRQQQPAVKAYKSLDTTSTNYLIPKGLMMELSDDQKVLFIATKNLPISRVYLLDAEGLVRRAYSSNTFYGTIDLAVQARGTYFIRIELTDGNYTLVSFKKEID